MEASSEIVARVGATHITNYEKFIKEQRRIHLRFKDTIKPPTPDSDPAYIARYDQKLAELKALLEKYGIMAEVLAQVTPPEDGSTPHAPTEAEKAFDRASKEVQSEKKDWVDRGDKNFTGIEVRVDPLTGKIKGVFAVGSLPQRSAESQKHKLDRIPYGHKANEASMGPARGTIDPDLIRAPKK